MVADFAQVHDLVLLQGLTRDIEWQIVGVDNTTYKVEIPWKKILELFGNKDTTNVKLHLALLSPVVVEHVHRSLLRHEQDGLEVDLT